MNLLLLLLLIILYFLKNTFLKLNAAINPVSQPNFFELSHRLLSASTSEEFEEINNAEQFLSLLQESGKTCIAPVSKASYPLFLIYTTLLLIYTTFEIFNTKSHVISS